MKAAFFDLDNTLIKQDSLPYFLASLRGWPWTIAAYAYAIAIGGWQNWPGAFDRRGRIKAALFRVTLRGINQEHARQSGNALRHRLTWSQNLIDVLRHHKQDGHTIIVITGAPELYLEGLLAGLPVDHVIATRLEIVAGVLTGRLAGENCVRTEKSVRVRDWIAAHQPEETWGYGNAPHDLPFLELMDHAVVVD